MSPHRVALLPYNMLNPIDLIQVLHSSDYPDVCVRVNIIFVQKYLKSIGFHFSQSLLWLHWLTSFWAFVNIGVKTNLVFCQRTCSRHTVIIVNENHPCHTEITWRLIVAKNNSRHKCDGVTNVTFAGFILKMKFKFRIILCCRDQWTRIGPIKSENFGPTRTGWSTG